MRTPLPHIIVQAQNAARSDSELKSLLVTTIKKLSTLSDAEKLSYVKDKIDLLIFREDFQTSCKKGCNYCCYHPISISEAEGEVLEKYKDKCDQDKLSKQANDYDSCTYEDKACIFLKDGNCTVYKDRPIICRLTYVINKPEYCHLENKEQKVSHLPMTKAALVAGAYFMTCSDTKLLPHSL